MAVLALEHSKAMYGIDFALYSAAALGLSGWLLAEAPAGHGLALLALAFAGLACWTFIEYALHRFVLHGLEPFRSWHAEHHDRPMALICTPTIFSGALIALLVFLPVLLVRDIWAAAAITLGVLVGYLMYSVTHHATHHWQADHPWLKRRKRWHAMHHHVGEAYYGVSSGFWDRVLVSTARTVAKTADEPA
jgi:hypothetical protein